MLNCDKRTDDKTLRPLRLLYILAVSLRPLREILVCKINLQAFVASMPYYLGNTRIILTSHFYYVKARS